MCVAFFYLINFHALSHRPHKNSDCYDLTNLQLRAQSCLIVKSLYVLTTVLIKEKESEIAELCGINVGMVKQFGF